MWAPKQGGQSTFVPVLQLRVQGRWWISRDGLKVINKLRAPSWLECTELCSPIGCCPTVRLMARKEWPSACFQSSLWASMYARYQVTPETLPGRCVHARMHIQTSRSQACRGRVWRCCKILTRPFSAYSGPWCLDLEVPTSSWPRKPYLCLYTNFLLCTGKQNLLDFSDFTPAVPHKVKLPTVSVWSQRLLVTST